MSKSDGTISFSITVDDSELEADLEEAKERVQELEAEVKKLDKERTSSIKKQEAAQERLNKAQEKYASAEEKSAEATDAALDAKKRLCEAEQKLIQIEKEREGYEAMKLGKTTPESAANAKDYVDNFRTDDEWKQAVQGQKAEVTELTKEWERAQNAATRYGDKLVEAASGVMAAEAALEGARSNTQSIETDIEGVAEELDEAKEKAGELEQQLNESSGESNRLAEAQKKASEYMGKFANRVKKLAARVFVFTLITSALRSLKNWMWSAIKTNDEAVAAVAQLKGALYTLAQPLVNIIIPAFTKLVTIMAQLVTTAAKLVSSLFGSSLEQTAADAEALYNNLNDADDAAESAQKSLAGFDEINQLSSDSSSSASSDEIGADFSGVVSGGLSAVAELFAGVALLALGAILTFTGISIPVGLAMMAAGALMVYGAVSGNWNELKSALEGTLGWILAAVGTALLVVGAILAFSGTNIPLGIALMIVGAAGLATGAAANWDTIKGFVSENITAILGIVTAALLAIGAIIAFSGNLPLGIALLAAGAIGLVALAVINEDAINEALQGPIGVIVALVGGALLAIGAILAFTGVNLPLGIGLLTLGAATLCKVATVNWDTITEAMQGPIGTITALASGALLVLGIILLLTGAGIPLGLGLILAGAAGLATAVAFNWDTIVEKVKECWGKIKDFWNQHIAQVFTAEFWKDLGKKAINGLISIVETGLNAVLSGAGSLVNKITGLLSKIPGIDIGEVNWGNVKLPRLATGAVIPPNKEFLAVLGDQKQGTNIETPLATMIEAFKTALAEMGGAGGGTVTVVVNLDGEEVARNTVRHVNQMTQRTGECPLAI